MNYSEKDIIGQKEDQTTEFKEKYDNDTLDERKEIAMDICSFANTVHVSHIYYGVKEIKDPKDKYGPGIADEIKEINEEDFSQIKDSIEKIIDYRLIPKPNLCIVHVDEKFVKVTIYPTNTLCEVILKENTYRVWERRGHSKKEIKHIKEKMIIQDNKQIYRVYELMKRFEKSMEEAVQFESDMLTVYEGEINEAFLKCFSIYGEKSYNMMCKWLKLLFVLKGNSKNWSGQDFKSIMDGHYVKEYKQILAEYKSLINKN